jgi:hypothetical protein
LPVHGELMVSPFCWSRPIAGSSSSAVRPGASRRPARTRAIAIVNRTASSSELRLTLRVMCAAAEPVALCVAPRRQLDHPHAIYLEDLDG